jgi:hypothetical protein
MGLGGSTGKKEVAMGLEVTKKGFSSGEIRNFKKESLSPCGGMEMKFLF